MNPELLRLARRDDWAARKAPSRPARGGRRPARFRPPRRPEVIERLDRAGLLPAITFIFSRAGCDAAVRQCLDAGLRLTTPDEAAVITEIAERRTRDIPEADLPVLGYGEWLTGLQRGIAAHHAGMLPTFKEVVEELFEAGLVRAVFATETLALGINMPARTVVIERLDKWNGETHADLTPGEYTQLTGRAGRRGIDVEGHAVVLWQPGVDPLAVAGLAGTRTYPLNSSFRPSYNMAVNLVGQVGLDQAAALLESSFAQFQADRAVVGIARQARRSRAALAETRAGLRAGRLRRVPRAAQGTVRAGGGRGPAAVGGPLGRGAAVTGAAAPGRHHPGPRRPPGRVSRVVLQPGLASRPAQTGPSPRCPAAARAHRQPPGQAAVRGRLPGPGHAIDRVRIPNRFSARSPQHRRDLASTMRNKLAGRDLGRRPPQAADAAGRAPAADEITRLRRQLRQHPCHGCPDREMHARQAEQRARLEREVARLEAQRGGPLARDRADLRPGLRGTGPPGVPRRRPGHPGRQAAR